MMAYTTTKSVGWFARLGSSFRGIGMGIALIIGGTMLLWWNEGNFVETGDALNEARSVTQALEDISRVDASKHGQLVHASGAVETKDMLNDTVFGFSVNAIRLERSVEFFQWVEESKSETRNKVGGGTETVTTYSYVKKWTSRPVNSSAFKDPQARRENVNTVLSNMENSRVQATNVNFGAYRLPSFLINSIGGAQPLDVLMLLPEASEPRAAMNKKWAMAAAEARGALRATPQSAGDAVKRGLIDGVQEGLAGAPADSRTYDERLHQDRLLDARGSITENTEMIHVNGGTILLSATPNMPQIGDLRVTFRETKPGTVSILAKVNGDTFEQFRASNGKTVGELVMGTHSVDNMYGDAHSSNTTMTWILRGVGTMLVFLGLKMVVAPIEVFASVIPLLGSIVGAGTGIVSTLLSLAWSLVIISIAWLRFRPVIGAIMLAAAGALIALLYVKGRARKVALEQMPANRTG
jgi:hypothetical protein